MIVNISNIKEMFNRQYIKTFLIDFLVWVSIAALGICISFILIMEIILTNYYNYMELNKQIANPDKTVNYYNRCMMLNCYLVVFEDDSIYGVDKEEKKLVYLETNKKRVDNLTKSFSWFDGMNDEFDFVIGATEDNKHIKYIVNNERRKEIFFVYFPILLAVFAAVLIYFFQSKMKVVVAKDIYEKGAYKLYLQNQIQLNYADMLNHEINTPLAILKELVKELPDHIDGVKNKDYLDAYNYVIYKIEAIVQLLSTNKKIKLNEEISIFDLIDNSMKTINRLNVLNLNHEFEITSDTVLQSFCLQKTLAVGEFLNVLQVLFNNAKEASCTKLVFTASIINNYLFLSIRDNGTGIRDKAGNLLKNDVIFNYGYSHKYNKDNNNKDCKKCKLLILLTKVLRLVGIRVVDNSNHRGIGLYAAKTIMKKAKGDIILDHTSLQGTTFILKIPVKPLNKK